MTCEYCEIIEGKGRAEMLYQDDEVAVAIKDLVFSPGQITIFPKKHFTILESVPDNILAKCALAANKVSVSIFDGLGAQGTNVLVQNGISAGQKVPHFAIEVIPRQENDGLNLLWQPKQLMEDEMEVTFLALEEGMKKMPEENKSKEQKPTGDEKSNENNEKIEGRNNYMIKQIRRLP